MADDGLSSPVRQCARALGYEHWDMLLLEDSLPFRQFIAFLENRKIRHYPIEKREVTKTNLKSWMTVFKKYLSDLGCPYSFDVDPQATTFWVASHAMSLEYEDKKDVYNQSFAAPLPGKSNSTASDPILEKLEKLATSVGIPEHDMETNPELVERAQLVERVVKRKFSARAVRASKTKKMSGDEEVSLQNFPLGFSTGKTSLDRAAVVFKMLYLAELCERERELNRVLTTAQQFTGDPKADTKLGKVGR